MSALIQPSFPRLARPPYRALVVDDERLLRKVVGRGLKLAGFDVEEAANGQIALARVREAYFDLIISDVRMPLMGGLELLRAVHLEQPEMPFILLSASTEVAGREAARALGAADFFQKPFSSSELQQSALSLAAGRQGAPLSAVR